MTPEREDQLRTYALGFADKLPTDSIDWPGLLRECLDEITGLRASLAEATTDSQWGQPVEMPKGPHSPRGAPTWYCSRCHATNSPTTTTCLWCANPRDPD